MRNFVRFAALAATVAAASPALAQVADPEPSVSASASATVKGVVLQPLTLTKESDLDFGTVISTAAPGTVTINADSPTGGRQVADGVLAVPSYPGSRGLFTGNASIGRVVNLTLSAPEFLVSTTNPLDLIVVNEMVLDSDNSTTRTVGNSGIFQVGVGGEFAIAANQPNGLYQAQFDLTADYQ